MSFKVGIPLLTALDDEETETDDDLAVELSSSGTRHKWSRRHVLFAVVLALVVFVVVSVIVAITVPVVLLQGGEKVGSDTESSMNFPASLRIANINCIIYMYMYIQFPAF